MMSNITFADLAIVVAIMFGGSLLLGFAPRLRLQFCRQNCNDSALGATISSRRILAEQTAIVLARPAA